MQLQNYFAQDRSGNALPGATVYVLLAGTATMATGLQDKNGAAKTNPFLSDSQGLIQFAAENGDYDIRVVKGPHDYKLTSVRFEDSKQFRLDIANTTDPAKGAGMVGWIRDDNNDPANSVGNFLSRQAISVWEFAHLVVSKPNPNNPATWDWTPALNALFASLVDGDEVRITHEILTMGGHTISAPNITISGPGGYSKAMIKCVTPGAQVLTVTSFGFVGKNFAILGDGGANGVGATVKGIRFARADNTKDVDASLQNVSLAGLAECAFMRGTNLLVDSCTISSSLLGIDFLRNGTDESRGLRVRSTRFHSMGTIGTPAICVRLNADAFDCEVSGNFADSIYTFYDGPINGTAVDGNHIYRLSGPGINVVAATFTSQQRCGSVNDNLLFINIPSAVGNGITLRMLNGQCANNRIIGARAHGIELIGTTASSIVANQTLDHNFNVGSDGAIYDGISADGSSTNNLIASNHIRGGAAVGRSAINVPANNAVMSNWVSTTYATPYFTAQPLTAPEANSRFSVQTAGANGLILRQDTGNSVQSSRVYFTNATPAQGWSILNNNASLDFNNGAIPGTGTGTAQFRVMNDSSVRFPNIATTASAANAFLDSGAQNSILRSTSSQRYKADIQDLDLEAVERAMQLRPVRYRSLAPLDREDWTWYGLIAEEVAEIDPRLVHWSYLDSDYDEVVQDGEPTGERTLKDGAVQVPDGVQYERLSVLLLKEVQRLRERIAALEAK